MATKPKTYEGYQAVAPDLAYSTCLYVATKLGALKQHYTVVGGFVPYLLVPQDTLPEETRPHVGTTDLDLGLSLEILVPDRYQKIEETLRGAGFDQDLNEKGNPTRERWKLAVPNWGDFTVDFLLPADHRAVEGGSSQGLTPSLAAFVTPGLHLAFEDQVTVTLDGTVPLPKLGTPAKREVSVCGPAAFIVLKALAWGDRTEPKDAYDLHYVLANYPEGIGAIAARLRPFLDDSAVQQAIEVLRSDFETIDSLGPMNLAAFLLEEDEALRADCAGFVAEFLRRLFGPGHDQ